MIGKTTTLEQGKGARTKLERIIDGQKPPVQVLKTQLQYNKNFGYYIEALTETENFQDTKDRLPVSVNGVLIVVNEVLENNAVQP